MFPIIVAVLVIAVLVWTGFRRSRRSGQLDPLHPLLYPTVYISVASLAPSAWLYTQDDLGFIRLATLSDRTALLMSLAAVGFAVGAWLPFGRREFKAVHRDGSSVTLAGRLVLLLPIVLAFNGFLGDAVLTRGLGQATRTLTDSLDAAGFIFAPAAAVLIACGRAPRPSPYSRGDLLALATLIALLGLNGKRGASIAVVLVVVFAYTDRLRKRSKTWPFILGGTTLLGFAYAVVSYRTAATGGQVNLSATEVLLRDLGSVPFTTGMTDRLMDTSDPLGGSTIVAGFARQLPGPVAQFLLGPPDDTGAFVFRDLYGVPDNMGYGYSIPAEGVLNFGVVGAFLLPFLLGAILAKLYSLADFNATRAVQLGYYVAAATLPFAWRSDILGAVKGVAYPVVLTWLVFSWARAVYRLPGRARLRRHETLGDRQTDVFVGPVNKRSNRFT